MLTSGNKKAIKYKYQSFLRRFCYVLRKLTDFANLHEICKSFKFYYIEIDSILKKAKYQLYNKGCRVQEITCNMCKYWFIYTWLF